MNRSRLCTPAVMMPLLLLVLLTAGIGFGYYKHLEFADQRLREKQYLYGNSPGEMFDHNRVVLAITARVYDLDITRICVKRFRAWDSSGTQCPWMSRLFACSEAGPGMRIAVDSHAAKDLLTASGEFCYKGKMYSIEAQWKEKPSGWSPPGAMEWHQVSCTIQPSVFPPEGENP